MIDRPSAVAVAVAVAVVVAVITGSSLGHRKADVASLDHSADYMQGTHVKFDTKEQAMHFCEKQGWEYFVQEPAKSKFVPKSYSTYVSLHL